MASKIPPFTAWRRSVYGRASSIARLGDVAFAIWSLIIKLRSASGQIQSAAVLILFTLAALASCSRAILETRISGNYVAHNDNFAENLELTQTGNGQITGVLAVVQLNLNGKVESLQVPVSGTEDNGQITFQFHNGFAGFGTTSMSGTIQGSTITIQQLSSAGEVQSDVFHRASPAEFKRYADAVKARVTAFAINAVLQKSISASDQTIGQAESWISNARFHEQRIAGVEEQYRELEGRMLQLLERQKITVDGVDRSQVSVAIAQVNVAGINLDVEGDTIWNPIMGDATGVSQRFENIALDCAASNDKLRALGVSQPALEGWRANCESVLSSREKFSLAFRDISAHYSELKAFKADAQKRREAIVEQSTRLN